MTTAPAKHLPIEQTEMFNRFVAIADELWNAVETWDSVPREVIGKQVFRAIESVGANLVEGDGRYATGDSLHFFTIARASARETRYWIRRAAKRGLLPQAEAAQLDESLDHATRALNNLITFRRKKAAELKVREDRIPYPNTEHRTPNTVSDQPLTSACTFMEDAL